MKEIAFALVALFGFTMQVGTQQSQPAAAARAEAHFETLEIYIDPQGGQLAA